MELLNSILVACAIAPGLAATDDGSSDRGKCHDLARCGGYSVSHVVQTPGSGLEADLHLTQPGCAQCGADVVQLKLVVEYQTNSRLRVVIRDVESQRHQTPAGIFPNVSEKPLSLPSEDDSLLEFAYTASPFSFQIKRRATGELLFDTSAGSLVFKPQVIRLKSFLPPDPNIYGLGEHIDSFRLPNRNYTRGFWNRDSDGVPYGENLYGTHPVYLDHRLSGIHGVFLANSNGMDVKLDIADDDKDHEEKHTVEYVATGGIFDFYFLAGPTPVSVARQYAQVVGTPAMVPYWSLGFHQCKFGYQDWFQVAEVISNYSLAGIPLETMWTDIDYGNHRRVFSLDEERFPLHRMREIVHHLHSRQQHCILMVDPAVALADYGPYHRGREMDVFLKDTDSTYFRGVVWPGVTVFPDWYHPNATPYWVERFQETFDPRSGIDVDGIWIDMNEPANMCRFPCNSPEQQAKKLGMPPDPPPTRLPPRPIPGFSTTADEVSTNSRENPLSAGAEADLHDDLAQVRLGRRQDERRDGADDDAILNPPYRIANGGPSGDLSDLTVPTNVKHHNGLLEYDVHNLY